MPTNCSNLDNMGIGTGGGLTAECFPKFTNRWVLHIENVSGIQGENGSINALPPIKGSRPQFEFKEQTVQHLVQPIYYPIKADWKPLQLTLYDITPDQNLVFNWLIKAYDPSSYDSPTQIEWRPIYTEGANPEGQFKRTALLCMYDGCGNVVEKWKYENCYPKEINFGELNMDEMKVVTIDVTLRYDRAYIFDITE